jgi:hypothetical protein
MAQGYKVKDKYELGPKIGEGMFGKVRAADTAPDSVGADSNSNLSRSRRPSTRTALGLLSRSLRRRPWSGGVIKRWRTSRKRWPI